MRSSSPQVFKGPVSRISKENVNYEICKIPLTAPSPQNFKSEFRAANSNLNPQA
jgi:hypothetical protein